MPPSQLSAVISQKTRAPHGGDAEDESSHDHHYSTPLTTNAIRPATDSPDEWEYEYSSTETETYYVTLDLSTPNVTVKRRATPKSGRGSNKARWINPGMGRHKRQLQNAPKFQTGTNTAKDPTGNDTIGGNSPQKEAEEDAEVEGGDENTVPDSDALSNSRLAGESTVKEVQILDLHTENPIVSYEGHVYSCEWAENIGTELLFTARDPEHPLPLLRSLPGDVDLLAASSARIIAASATLETRNSRRSGLSSVLSARRGGRGGRGNVPDLSIPVGLQASAKRKEQARFLERMMEIKQEKGEHDEVTVIAQKRQTNTGWRVQMRQQRQQERRSLESVAAGFDAVESAAAKEKLAEMDREDGKRMRNEEAMRAGKAPSSLGRKRKHDADDEGFKREASIIRRPRGGMHMALAHAESRLGSEFMTPERWAGQEEDVEMDAGDTEDGEFDEDGEVDD